MEDINQDDAKDEKKRGPVSIGKLGRHLSQKRGDTKSHIKYTKSTSKPVTPVSVWSDSTSCTDPYVQNNFEPRVTLNCFSIKSI